jgi:hypothetical protein
VKKREHKSNTTSRVKESEEKAEQHVMISSAAPWTLFRRTCQSTVAMRKSSRSCGKLQGHLKTHFTFLLWLLFAVESGECHNKQMEKRRGGAKQKKKREQSHVRKENDDGALQSPKDRCNGGRTAASRTVCKSIRQANQGERGALIATEIGTTTTKKLSTFFGFHSSHRTITGMCASLSDVFLLRRRRRVPVRACGIKRQGVGQVVFFVIAITFTLRLFNALLAQ